MAPEKRSLHGPEEPAEHQGPYQKEVYHVSSLPPQFPEWHFVGGRAGPRDSGDFEEMFITPQSMYLPLPSLLAQCCSELGHSQPQACGDAKVNTSLALGPGRQLTKSEISALRKPEENQRIILGVGVVWLRYGGGGGEAYLHHLDSVLPGLGHSPWGRFSQASEEQLAMNVCAHSRKCLKESGEKT